LFTLASKVRLQVEHLSSHPLISGGTKGYYFERACGVFLRPYPIFENNSRPSHISVLSPMAEHPAGPFKNGCAKDKIPYANNETHPSDSLFTVIQTQSDIPGEYSGNNGNNSAYGSYNNKVEIVLPSGAGSGAQNQGLPPGAGEAGIIRIPRRYRAKN